jgi:hypothetical protein
MRTDTALYARRTEAERRIAVLDEALRLNPNDKELVRLRQRAAIRAMYLHARIERMEAAYA